jgi:hypothetical protein
MAETLLLDIKRHYGPFRWDWELTGPRGLSIASSVELKLDDPRDQELVDRARPGIGPPDPALRSRLRESLVGVIGGEMASAISSRAVGALHLEATPADRGASSLPLELLFENPSAVVVRRIVIADADRSRGEHRGGVLGAFALCSNDRYLRLHAEAERLEDAAAAGGHEYRELFVTFTADDFLTRSAGRRLVHLAGHGTGTTMRCPTPAGLDPAIAAEDMTRVWAGCPPDVVVLNFCESSSDSDLSSLFSVAWTGGLELTRYTHDHLTGPRRAASASMALDLVAGVPTAVVAMRTSIGDAAATEFVAAFYREYLGRRASLIDAFSYALASSGPLDHAGVPIPVLYVSREPPDWDDPPALPARAPGRRPHRRLLNYHYQPLSTLSPDLSDSWSCSINGRDGTAADAITTQLADAVAQQAVPGPLREASAFASTRVLICGRPDPAAPVVSVDLAHLPAIAAYREIVATDDQISHANASLLTYAGCQVPSVIEALRGVPVAVIADSLRHRLSDRSPLVDRSLRWDLARTLLTELPTDARLPVKTWSDKKWDAVCQGGSLAVDAVAAWFVLDVDANPTDAFFTLLGELADAHHLPLDAVQKTVSQLVANGVFAVSPVMTEATSGDVVIEHWSIANLDLLTASRAWAACSDVAARIYVNAYLDRATRAIHTHEGVDTVPVPDMIALASICLEVRDRSFWRIVHVLNQRSESAAAEQLLAEASAVGFTAPHDLEVGPEWIDLEKALLAGQTSIARSLLQSVATTTPDLALAHRVFELALDRDLHHRPDALKTIAQLKQAVMEQSTSRNTAVALISTLGLHEAKLHEQNGDSDAAVAALAEVAQTVRTLDATVDQIVRVESLLAKRLRDAGHLPEARAVVDRIVVLAQHTPPSATRCSAMAADLSLLALEHRVARIPPASERLLRSLLQWRRPHADIMNDALTALAIGELALQHGRLALAWFALAAYVHPDESEPYDINTAARCRATWDVSEQEIIEAASELEASAATLCDNSGLERPPFKEFATKWAASLPVLPLRIQQENFLGAENLAALITREEAGCFFASLALKTLARPASAAQPILLPPDWEPAQFDRLGGRHVPLWIAVARALPERLTAELPILRAANHGDIDARFTFIGLLAGDFQEGLDTGTGWSRFLLELSLGKDWPVLRPLLVDLGGSSLLHAGIALEACRLEQITTEASDETNALTEIGAAQWLLFVEQASWHFDTASALMRMLRAAAGLAPAVAAINGESLTATRGSSDSALTARIFDEIRGNEQTRKLLAEAAIAESESEAGMSLLLRLTENGSPGAAIAGLESMLRHFVSTGDRESVSATLPNLLARAKTVEPGGDSWLLALAAGAESAMWLGDTDTAAKLGETLVYGPGPATSEHAANVRLPASFQLLTALVEARRV